MAGIIAILLMIHLTIGSHRFVISIFIAFLISFFLYQLTNSFIYDFDISKEVKVLVNRGLLLMIFLGISIVNLYLNKKITFFNHKPKWSQSISMPFHTVKLSRFMLIGLIVSVIAFLPFLLQQDSAFIKSILLFAILFSIINASLEEMIWRGIMLTNLMEHISVINALIITSIGFGLLHVIVGIPFIVSLLFSFGGLFYGMVVIKSNSIFPAIALHFVVNMGMVLSGFIL
ncbi:CPBP family intramembrane glutamic endopeptidase [Bhargavaea changchunensis]|uniref:CPBP family intramembrane glutamic endopeptidase n=1 Tax=Bhargavaea changchunensis TaxID=2134037 RepID=UPI00366AF16D